MTRPTTAGAGLNQRELHAMSAGMGSSPGFQRPDDAFVSRRGFLAMAARSAVFAGALPAALAAASRANAGTASAVRAPVIDTHMHVWSDDPVRFPFSHPYNPDTADPKDPATLEMLLADMDQGGVTHCILIQTICHGWDNSYVAHCLKLRPDRFRAHGLIDPTDPNVAQKLEYWMTEHGFSGMRFSAIYYRGKDEWLTAPSSRALWKKADELDAVFNFFIATDQLPKLERMVQRYPAVRVAIDHISQIDLGADDPLPAMKKLLALARYPNVFVKVSELTSVSKSGKYPFCDVYPWVKRVYDAFGPDRLLWGTGYPGAARAVCPIATGPFGRT